jgi:hypothetical protein
MSIIGSTHLLRRAAALAAAPALALTFAACGGDDDGGGGDSASFCEEVEGPFQGIDDPNADPEETVAAMREVEAPDEIAEDWDTLIGALEAIQDLDAEGADDADVVEQLSNPELQEAGENVEAYLTEECDL